MNEAGRPAALRAMVLGREGDRASKKENPAKPTLNVLVTVDDRHRDGLEAVARRLKSAGMNVAEVFPLGGVIAGAVAPADLGKLRSVEGIASIEEESRFNAL